MSAKDSNHFHATAWTPEVVATFLLYVLTSTPVAIVIHSLPHGPIPRWLEWYCAPMGCVYDRFILERKT